MTPCISPLWTKTGVPQKLLANGLHISPVTNASGIIAWILRRKLVKMAKTANSYQEKQLLKQWLSGKKAQKLHVAMQFMIIVCAWFMFAVKCILVDNI